jgi:hypothetical protein
MIALALIQLWFYNVDVNQNPICVSIGLPLVWIDIYPQYYHSFRVDNYKAASDYSLSIMLLPFILDLAIYYLFIKGIKYLLSYKKVISKDIS